MVAIGKLGNLAFGQNVNPRDEIETMRGSQMVIHSKVHLQWFMEEHANFVDAPVFRDGKVIRIPALKAEVAKHNAVVQAWCDKYGCE
jgi:hypothetical protein